MTNTDIFALKVILVTRVALVFSAAAATVAGYVSGHPSVAWIWLAVLLLFPIKKNIFANTGGE
jgi:type III secretory pathway component EscV